MVVIPLTVSVIITMAVTVTLPSSGNMALASPITTQASPIMTQASPIITQASPIMPQASPVMTLNAVTTSLSGTPLAGSVTSSADLNLWTVLPRAWSSMCTVDYDVDPEVDASIKCDVTSSDKTLWSLADLRTSLTSLVESTGLKVAVTLLCEDGGSVSLPYPWRAPGLVKLTVHSCRMLDKYADFGTAAQSLGDWLTHVDIRDCVWVNDPAHMDRILSNLANLTSHYECGQDSTLVSYVYRNVSDESNLNELASTALNDLDLSDIDLGALLGDDDLAGLLNGTGGLGGMVNGSNDPWAAAGLGGGVPGGEEGGLSDVTAASTTASKGGEDILNTLVGLDKIDHKCLYAHLEVQDESLSPTTNRNHFEFMVMGARYPQLRLLNYSYIGLTEVPPELRQWRRKFYGSKLGVIDLSHNYVTQVGPIPPYPSFGIPTTLVLQHNNISTVTMEMLEEWALVQDFVVDIRHNPIHCDCDMAALLNAFRNHSRWAGPAMAQYRRHLSNMTCATPPPLASRVIGSLSVSDLPCPVVGADLRPAMAVLIVVVVVLVVLLVLAVKYRKEVRILMFTRVHILLPCGVTQQSGGDVQHKVYDAFVSYAHQDSDWVLGTLMKRLEGDAAPRGPPPVKLCVHQRDFVVGKPIIDNIVDCIAASRHTIIVLSKHFVKSRWGMEELLQAYRQSMEERRRHLVVVVLEDVPQADMTPVLRRCCKTFTYLNANDTLFWDRLLYSLHVSDPSPSSNSDDKKKGKVNGGKTSDEYDDISHPDDKQSKGSNSCLQNGTSLPGETSEDSEFRKALFSENMRMTSVDSTCTTVSDSGVPVTPSQVTLERPLFETQA